MLGASNDGEENPYLLSSNTSSQTTGQTAGANTNNQPKQASVGQAMKEGDLEFTVKGVRCDGERTIGENQYSRAEAEGQFCRVSVSVKNIGKSALSLPLPAQKGFVSKEESSPPQTDATQYAQADQTKGYWYEQIAPGKTVSGDLVFDVNGNEEIILVELHSAENSPGIRVATK